jgi:hypothetical protein
VCSSDLRAINRESIKTFFSSYKAAKSVKAGRDEEAK